MTVEASAKRPLRADAARNQARILAAARSVFSARTLDVSLDDIARHAGVGVATLYRRYPDRESLVAALFEIEMQGMVEIASHALAAPDPWEGFTTLLCSMFRSVAEDRGLRQSLLSSRQGQGVIFSSRLELIRLLTLVVKRTQDDGRLRSEITAQDIPPMILMVGVVADFSSRVNSKLWKRYGALLIDALSARGEQASLKPKALTPSELLQASELW
ncbi:TetR/AcrR family transcriptional regulator [Rhodopila sp.]|uniref:TetR/AcrR family transcriptional regulator n=1 Tax=Rhodopila sp. TaxID=2480087 RepID=UPI003D129271